jgi:hypothetical protein
MQNLIFDIIQTGNKVVNPDSTITFSKLLNGKTPRVIVNPQGRFITTTPK